MTRFPGKDPNAAADGPQGAAVADALPPQRADVASLARDAVQLRGRAAASRLARLAHELAPDAAPAGVSAGAPAGTSAAIRWTMSFSVQASAGRSSQPWLHLSATGELPLTCQRCLTTVMTPLGVERDFRFVVDEQTAEREDEDSEEDVLAPSSSFNLRELLEDELLMALPLVPRHEICPTSRAGKGEDARPEAPLAGKPNPFAVLEQLKVPRARGRIRDESD